VVDIGHCAGKVCFSCSLLGWEAVGIGGCAFSVVATFFTLTMLFAEMDDLRWSLSVHMLKDLLHRRVLGPSNPPVNLMRGDASKVFTGKDGRFSFYGTEHQVKKRVLVYCWDRGLGKRIFRRIANAAFHSPRVAGNLFLIYARPNNPHAFCLGFFSERNMNRRKWEQVGWAIKVKANKVNARMRLWRKKGRERGMVGAQNPGVRLERSSMRFLVTRIDDAKSCNVGGVEVECRD
jgi:hypothetical protein